MIPSSFFNRYMIASVNTVVPHEAKKFLEAKPNDLSEDGFPFLVHSTACFEHNWSKVVVRLIKCGRIAINFLSFSI